MLEDLFVILINVYLPLQSSILFLHSDIYLCLSKKIKLMNRKTIVLVLFSIVAISFVMHYNHFSKELMSMHVWRQTQTQSTINNFYSEDMNIFNPRRNERGNGDGIFRMEFPLMQWMVACIYNVSGNHLIYSRRFLSIVGILSVLGMFKLLESIFGNSTIGLLGAWAFNFSPSFYYFTINPIPDNFALCCSIWGITIFFIWIRNSKVFYLTLSAFLLSIGSLCKLPFIVYFAVPFTYFLIQLYSKKDYNDFFRKTIIYFVFILFPVAWYVRVVPTWHGNGIVQGMLKNDSSFIQILNYLQGNLISNLPELLLNYGSVPFFIAGFYYLFKKKAIKNKMFPLFLIWSIGILFYFFFEINMIGTVHDYYLFPFYPVLFIVVSYGAFQWLSSNSRIIKYITFFLLTILPFTAYLRMCTRWDLNSPGFNKDLLTYKEELRKAVPDNSLCIAGNDESHFIFLYYIDKKGWGLDNDKLNSEDLQLMIKNGASYLYSDSRTIDTSKVVVPFIDQLVLEKGSVKIFRLKSNVIRKIGK